jgi:hypothetical protein
MEEIWILKYHMSTMDGGGTGFTLQELSMITAEDRRWFIKRLQDEKEKEHEKLEEAKGGSSYTPSMPNMPSISNPPNIPNPPNI